MLALLLENTVTAAALAVLVLVLCRSRRFSPPVRHALWLVVVLKLLSPVGFLGSVPLPFSKPRWLSEAVTAATAAPESRRQQRETPPAEERLAREDSVRVTMLMIDPDPRTGMAEASDSRRLEALPLPDNPVSSELSPQHLSPDSPGTEPEGFHPDLFRALQVFWLVGAGITACCYGRRTWRFARYARRGKRASASLEREVGDLAARLGLRTPRVRVLADLPSPVVWCLRHPVLLWPRGLQDRLTAGGRRGVLVHELAHLRRRDHWVRWLELAAAVVHWWNPLFWLARRQLRFHAELACDAWVTGILPDIRRDYAEALLEVCARFRRAAAPSPAVGVGGNGRDEFRRRLTMIMREPAPCRLAAGAKLSLVLFLLAALPAWSLGQSQAQPEKESRPVEAKDLRAEAGNAVYVVTEDLRSDTDADAARKMKDLEAKIAELTKQLQALKAARAGAGHKQLAPLHVEGAVKEGAVLILRRGSDGKVVEEKVKTVQGQHTPLKSQTVIGAATGAPVHVRIVGDVKSAAPQYKVIGADGKEIRGARVIVVEPGSGTSAAPAARWEARPGEVRVISGAHTWVQSAGAAPLTVPAGSGTAARIEAARGGVITLARTTYRLPKDKATALAAFLKENVKASVLELKVEGEGLTVTTTPETQAAIGGIVRLMTQGHAQAVQIRLRTLGVEKYSK